MADQQKKPDDQPRIVFWAFAYLFCGLLCILGAALLHPGACTPQPGGACLPFAPGWRETLDAILEFLARFFFILPLAAFVAAQVSHAPWARGWKLEHLFRRSKAELPAVEGSPLQRLVATLRKLGAKGNLVPDQIEAFTLEALALAGSPEAKDREAFDKIVDGKAKDAAEEILKRFTRDKDGVDVPTDKDRMRQVARLFAPYDAAKAEAAYKKALELDKAPCDAGFEYGVLELQLGERARDAGDLPIARASLKAAAALLAYHAKGKDAALAKDLQARARLAEAQVALAQGAQVAGREEAEKARALWVELAAGDPNAAEWLRGIVRTEMLLAELALAEGATARASGHLSEVIAAAERIRRQSPNSREAKAFAVEAYLQLAEIARRAGDLAAAQISTDEAERVGQSLLKPYATPREQREMRLDGLMRGAEFAVDAGDLHRAEKRLDEALKLLDEIGVHEPDNIAWRERRADVLKRLGDVTALAGGLPNARKNYERALDVVDALVAGSPQHFRWRWDKFLLHVQLARIAKALGETEASGAQVRLADEAITGMIKQWNLHPVIARTFSDFRIAQPEPQVRVDIF